MKGIMPKNKKSMEIGFNWMFAILAGGFILFLAIFAASKFIKTQESVLYTETAAQVVSIFDPLETGLAAGKSSEINFKKQSKFYFNCDYKSNSPFGKQSISFSEQTFGEKYGEKSHPVFVYDKYLFAGSEIEGKKLVLFSKPFFMPFKIADLVIILTDDYCFYDAPQDIREDVEGLNLQNIKIANSSDCKGIKVCFGRTSDCDMKVYLKEKYVQKGTDKLYYYDSLVYGAIFSSPDLYECNVKRLMGKFNELGKVYLEKIKVIRRKGCDSRVDGKLGVMMTTSKITSSKDLISLSVISEDINTINDEAKPGCKLFS